MITDTNNYSEISNDRIYCSSLCVALTVVSEVFTRVNNHLYGKDT